MIKTKRPEYVAWKNMKTRCRLKLKRFARYQGRGITVCDAWLHSFDQFYLDMGPRPSNKHSLDRIDNNGNYEPTNCRWATIIEQNRNKNSFAGHVIKNCNSYTGYIYVAGKKLYTPTSLDYNQVLVYLSELKLLYRLFID